jgi:hypothetical protein
MLLRSAMRAAVTAPRTQSACLVPCGARHVQSSPHPNVWKYLEAAAAAKPVFLAPAQLGTVTTAATAPAAPAAVHRALSLRCYSNAQASSSSSSTDSSTGPRKLKYNLRPLSKGKHRPITAWTAQPASCGGQAVWRAVFGCMTQKQVKLAASLGLTCYQ